MTFIEHLRGLADGRLQPAEAVRSYHAALQRLKIRPYCSLKKTCGRSCAVSAYGSSPPPPLGPFQTGRPTIGEPDFSKMTPAEKLAWNGARWKRILG